MISNLSTLFFKGIDMRFFIFLLDTFIITVIGNAWAEKTHRYHTKRGFYQMLYTSGLWLVFVYGLDYANRHWEGVINSMLGVPILVALVFGPSYLRRKYQEKCALTRNNGL